MKARQDLLKTFAIDYVSSVDNMRYKGNFTVKKLSIRDLATLGVRKAQLNGGMHYSETSPGRGVDEQTDNMNNMLAHLEISVKESPPWWNLDNITDSGLLGAVYKEVMDFETSFLSREADKRLSESGEAGNGSGQANAPSTNTSGVTRALVESEVSAALEP